MSSDRFDDNQKLPPWLRDVPLPPRPRANETAPQSAAPVPEAASAPTSPASDLPDWLRDVSAEPTGTPSSAASTPAASANDLPDWLRDFSNTPTGAGTQAPSSAGDQNQPGRPASAANNALPDWLQDLGGNGAPAAPAQANDIPERADLPDWLREVQDATPPPVTPPASAAPEAPAPSGEAMPSWLAGLADSETSAPNAWAPSPEPAAQRAPDDEQGMPNWLRPDAPASMGPAAAAQPSWLQPDDLPAQPQGPAPSASEDEDTLPSWLRSTPEDQSSSDNLAPFTLDDPGDTGGRAAPPRSSWLSNELEDDAGMPSWLQPGDASAGHTFRNEPSQQNDQASTSEAPSSGDVPSWLADTTSSAPEAPSSGDVPSWLKASAPAEP
ncbi:hypothetical protein SE17_34635, partial [Kouleothrix aurantiaca]